MSRKSFKRLSPIIETNETPKNIPHNFSRMKYKNPVNIKIIREINETIDEIKEIFDTFDKRSKDLRFTNTVRDLMEEEILKRINPLLVRIEDLKKELMFPQSRRTRSLTKKSVTNKMSSKNKRSSKRGTLKIYNWKKS